MKERTVLSDKVSLSGYMIIEYALTERALADRMSYSIEIRMGKDTVTLPDVTWDREKAFELFDKFRNGKVTPISAREVMEDLLP